MTPRATIAAAARDAVAALQDAQQARRTLDRVIQQLETATGIDPQSGDGKTLTALLHGAQRCRNDIHVAITRVPENAWRHWLREDRYAGVVETAESLMTPAERYLAEVSPHATHISTSSQRGKAILKHLHNLVHGEVIGRRHTDEETGNATVAA